MKNKQTLKSNVPTQWNFVARAKLNEDILGWVDILQAVNPEPSCFYLVVSRLPYKVTLFTTQLGAEVVRT